MTTRLTGAIVAMLLIGLAAFAAPTLTVDNETYDFGSINEGFPIEHTFVLTNTGDEILVIDDVRATCGCTTTELATNRLAPGESVEVHAILGTTSYGGQTVDKTIKVYSNDPRYSIETTGPDWLTLHITGKVLRMNAYNISSENLEYYTVALVDVRSPAEFAAGHLIGAINIPADDLLSSLDRLPKENSLVLYDADGSQAASVIESLHREGFPSSLYLAGGLAAWTRAFDSRYLDPLPADLDFGAPKTPIAGFALDATSLSAIFYVLVDLRGPDAFAEGHLIGAINIPLAEFTVHDLKTILGPLGHNVKVIVYDESGWNGDAVAQSLIAAGFTDAKSLLGGLDEWSRQYGDALIWTDEP